MGISDDFYIRIVIVTLFKISKLNRCIANVLWSISTVIPLIGHNWYRQSAKQRVELPQNNQISAQETQTYEFKYYKEIFNSKHGRQPKRVKVQALVEQSLEKVS